MKLPFLPSPWLILGVILALAGAWIHGRHAGAENVRADWMLEVAESDRRHAAELAALEKENAAIAAAQAEATRNMEAAYAQRRAADDAGRADFERRLAERLRASNARPPGCELPRAAPDPGAAQGDAAGGDIEFRGIDIEGVQRVRAVGLELQRLVREVCVPWAHSVGR